MSSKNTCDPCREIRITKVSDTLKSDVKNIAARAGITVSEFLKPVIDNILEGFPEELKNKRLCKPAQFPVIDLSKKKTRKQTEFRVRGTSKKTGEQIHNLAYNIDVDVADLLKVELTKRIAQYPEYMKKPMLD